MKSMQSFLMFFFILDQCYDQCKENDLGGLLGSISPELWEDGKPMDLAIYNDWKDKNDVRLLNSQNIVSAAYQFLECYQKKFGFDFTKTLKLLKGPNSAHMISNAVKQTNRMYEKFHYLD